MAKYIFPKDFMWGTATASYQIEGAYKEDGKGESIWDRFSHNPGNVLNNDNGDIACDHYHRFEDDIKLMKDLGLKTYRLSLSWPRIFPNGFGEPNKKGIEFYRSILTLLNEYDIKPCVTLYHWDLPQKLMDIGGWTNRKVVDYFTDYAKYVFEELGDLVPMWITHNEPWVVSFLGYWIGQHAPGYTDFSSALLTSYHLMLSHGRAVKAYRETGQGGKIGITLNLSPSYPATQNKEDIEAAIRQDGFANRWFLDPVLKGTYPQDMIDYYKTVDGVVVPDITEEDLRITSEPSDFLGINYYSSHVIFNNDSWPLNTGNKKTDYAKTDMGWDITPFALKELLIRLHKEYDGIDLYVTENGMAAQDYVNRDNEIEDYNRIDFLHRHFTEAYKAIEAGVNLKGYYVWSFMDNFEWAFGYSKRFGITYVDYKTQERIPKKSFYWYKNVIKNNGI